jgi:ethanolamine utilization protein EutA
VIHQGLAPGLHPEEIASSIQSTVNRFDLDSAADQFAIALDLIGALDYQSLVQLATGLREFSSLLPPEKPLLIIIDRDYAQVVGQTVKGMLPNRPLLVLDQIGLMEGDYIDIGTPLMDGRVVPLSVKTLVFYH